MTLIFNTNLHIAHRKIPGKFGAAAYDYRRFCAAPPMHVCGLTDRWLCHNKDEQCHARQCSSSKIEVREFQCSAVNITFIRNTYFEEHRILAHGTLFTAMASLNLLITGSPAGLSRGNGVRPSSADI